MRCGVVLLLWVLMVGLSGCSRVDLNARPVLGGEVGLSGLVVADRSVPRDDGPSLRSHSRAEWKARRLVVPVDGTVHGPIHRFGRTGAGGNARRGGLWPTAESAVSLGLEPRGPTVTEALTAPLEALLEVLWMPISVVMQPGVGQNGFQASPWTLSKRYPEEGEWTNVTGASVLVIDPADVDWIDAETEGKNREMMRGVRIEEDL